MDASREKAPSAQETFVQMAQAAGLRYVPLPCRLTIVSIRNARSADTHSTRGNRVTRRTDMQHLKDFMSTEVKVIDPDMTIAEAARTMRDCDFGMMPVGENDRMIGTISDRDITIRAVADGKNAQTTVRDVMSPRVI